MNISPSNCNPWVLNHAEQISTFGTTYVHDILVFSKDPMTIIHTIQLDYMLKGIGMSEYYLGGDFHTITPEK